MCAQGAIYLSPRGFYSTKDNSHAGTPAQVHVFASGGRKIPTPGNFSPVILPKKQTRAPQCNGGRGGPCLRSCTSLKNLWTKFGHLVSGAVQGRSHGQPPPSAPGHHGYVLTMNSIAPYKSGQGKSWADLGHIVLPLWNTTQAGDIRRRILHDPGRKNT